MKVQRADAGIIRERIVRRIQGTGYDYETYCRHVRLLASLIGADPGILSLELHHEAHGTQMYAEEQE